MTRRGPRGRNTPKSEAFSRPAGGGVGPAGPGEWPPWRPLGLEPEIGAVLGGLSEWALKHFVKVLCFCPPSDRGKMRAKKEATVTGLYQACRRNRLEFL